jgi:polysaccharide pyruvyl transferase WcaK-like protein
MIFEIRKVGFTNKGAELMLHAIIQYLNENLIDPTLAIIPYRKPYRKRAELGLYQIVASGKRFFGRSSTVIAPFKLVRENYGLILDRDIDIVLDAAGFSYGDIWRDVNCKELAVSSKKWKRQGKTIVLLPQALGPFEKKCNRKNIKEAVKNIDLIYARDKDSYNNLVSVVGLSEKIKMAPDFTNILDGIVPPSFKATNLDFCLIPNYRMIDKTSQEKSEAYIPLMVKCVKYIQSKGYHPFFLIHGGKKDRILAERINDSLINRIPLLSEDNPRKIKGIIGACKGTVGSRFHGLVSALSQSIPSLSTGWSHKYKNLFEDYNFPEGLIDVLINDDELYQRLDTITDKEKSEELKKVLKEKSEQQKILTRKMWEEVLGLLKVTHP